MPETIARPRIRAVLTNFKRKLKQPFMALSRAMVQRAAGIERKWFDNRPMMTREQIEQAQKQHKLEKIESVEGKIRIVPANELNGVQYALLTPACKDVLLEVADAFAREQTRLGLEKKFLSITSMTRDRERQDQLIKAGYPAAKESTHGLGEAFDINVKWFKKHSRQHFQVILSILRELKRQGRINLIDETAINGALHVARNPHWRWT